MDNKNFFRALFWALLVVLLWQMIAIRIWPPQPSPTPATTTTQPSTQPAIAATQPGRPVTAAAPFHPVGAKEVESIVLGDTSQFKKSPYRMEVVLSNLGASIATVDLSDHRQRVEAEERYRFLSPLDRGRGEGEWRSFAVEQINIDNHATVPLDTVPWRVERWEENGTQYAEFSVTILGGEKPVLEVVRQFALPAQSHESRRHDLYELLSLRNVSDRAHSVILTLGGPVGYSTEGTFGPDRKVFAAVRQDGIITLQAKDFKQIGKVRAFQLFPADAQSATPLMWLGGGNLYFTATMAPVDDEGRLAPGYTATVEGVDLDEDPATEADVTARLTTKPILLEPESSHTLRAELYIGPKDRKAFTSESNPDYQNREYLLQIKEGYGSCTFNFLTDLMIRLLNWLESIFHNFGVAIIFLVIIVRVILHPVTKKTQVNMVKMQQSMGSLQPKMEEIKKKYGSDPSRMQQEMMKLYREEGVNPFGQMLGCLPMFLQMPIWIALYSSLRNNVAMRGRGFIWWINDLTTPDFLVRFNEPIDLPLLPELTGFHLLPILVGVTMFAQQKLMPKPKKPAIKSDSPQAQQAEQMQKIMPYMSLIMIVLFYGFPSGLNLYIMTSSLIGAAEQVYIRKHISKRDLEGPAEKKPKKPRSGPSIWEKLQKQAEEAQKLRSQRQKKDKK